MDQSTRLGRQLYEAAEAGNTRKARRLIRAGADINVMTLGGCTPLMRAKISGHAGIVQALLDAGADPDVKDCHMYSAVFYMLSSSNTGSARGCLPRHALSSTSDLIAAIRPSFGRLGMAGQTSCCCFCGEAQRWTSHRLQA